MLLVAAPKAADPPTFVYTNNNTAGTNSVSAFRVDAATGELTLFSTVLTGGTGNGGGFFAAQRAVVCGTRLYVSNNGNASISAFVINAATGALALIAGTPVLTGASAGNGMSLDCTPNGQFLIAASAGSNTIQMYRINGNGTLSLTQTTSPAGSGISAIKISPNGQFLAVALNDSDLIAMYQINYANASLAAAGTFESPGTGSASGIDIDPTSTFIYTGQCCSTTAVDVFQIDAAGALTWLQTATASGQNSNVVLRGKYLFATNQGGSAAITVFSANADGTLTLVGSFDGPSDGSTPSGMAMNPRGTFLFTANFPNSVSSFAIGADGTLTRVNTYSTGQTSGIESLAVFPAEIISTTTQLSASVNPSNVGQTVTFTAIVTSQSGVNPPTGVVQLLNGSTVIGATSLSVIGANQSRAQFVIGTLVAGTHTIRASYLGANTTVSVFSASQSNDISQVVNKINTTTTVSSNANPSLTGQSVTVTASVKPVTGTTTPTGSVTFSEEGATLATVSLAGGSAAFTSSTLAIGSHVITATYNGNANLSGSTGVITQVVNKLTPALSNLAAPSITFGAASATASGSIRAASGAVPSGTVTITVNGVAQSAPIQADGSFATELATSTFSAGTYNVLYAYAGNATFNPAEGTAPLTVAKATPTVSNLSAPTITFGAAAATVSGSIHAASLIPTGAVTMTINGVAQSAQVQPDGSFATSFAASTLSAGTYNVQYAYAGDGNFNAADDATTLTVVKATPAFSNLSAPTISFSAAAVNIAGVLRAENAVPTGTVSITLDGATQSTGIAPDGSFAASVATSTFGAGTYTIQYAFNGDANFNAAQDATTLTVAKASSEITVTCIPGQVYSGVALTPCSATVTGAGGLNQALQPTYTNNVSAGLAAAAATFGGDANHEGSSASASFQIAPATLVVTANDASMVLGGPVPAFTASFSGFKNGETLATSDVSGSASLTTPATTQVGTYPIAAARGSLASNNYTFAFVNGALTVTYNVCLQYDPTKVHQSGSTIPIKLALCNAAGMNVSSPATTLHATSLRLVSTDVEGTIQDAGNANPDADFRMVGDGYLFNLQARGLATGTYELRFTASGDPAPHAARFQIR